jgi:hypothetical protein
LFSNQEDMVMEYRFVTLTSSGAAGHAEDWSCASDVEAVERASRCVPSFGGELWRGDRRLSVFAGPFSRSRPAGSGATPH